MDPAHRAAVLRVSDLPLGGDMFTSLYLLFAAIRARSTVALSGESADEVFGGYRWFHDAAAHADTFPWLAALGHPEARPLHTLFTDELVSSLDIPSYRADSYRSALAEVPHTGTTNPLERRMREVCYLHLTRFVQFLLDRKDRMLPIRTRRPSCTQPDRRYRRVLAEQGAQPRCHRRTVAADLREDWPAALQQAGFHPGRPTTWLAERLLPFLPDDAKDHLFVHVNELSAAGSQIAVEHIDGDVATLLREPMFQDMAQRFEFDMAELWPGDQHYDPAASLADMGGLSPSPGRRYRTDP